MSHEAAIEIIRNASGTQFHPEVVSAFIGLESNVIVEVEYVG